jgi:ATP-dependent DNA helicase RecG
MHLPINISNLLHESIVESDRIEFKADWNPQPILRTICAFANDFHNFGGGYIVIGVEDDNGKPILPPKGLELNQENKIQKELLRVCTYIKPAYTPIISFEKYQNKNILIIWVPGGQTRPYSAPKTLGKNNDKEYAYYIRKFSNSVQAKNDELKELIELTATVPFDDRINHHATLNDIKLTLIQSFLHDIKSELLKESGDIPLPDLCRQMAIADGGDEYLKPKNVGLLFFCDQPQKYFQYAQIDVVYFPDDEGGDIIQEEIFKGPLDHQLRSALRHISNSFISERIIKVPDQAEAIRFFNYPYSAIEEALVNAVYHRDYSIREPIEVRINRNSISIVSHPGPDPSISNEDMKSGQMVSRRYRNRRIGEFLKELDFTEGRRTGIPKMRRVLKANGSPEPAFYTDAARMSFWTEIKVHPEFLNERVPAITQENQGEAPDQATVEATVEATVNETELRILQLCLTGPISRKDILTKFGHKTFSGNMQSALRHLRDIKLIVPTIEAKPSSKNQRYKITEKGKQVLSQHTPL